MSRSRCKPLLRSADIRRRGSYRHGPLARVRRESWRRAREVPSQTFGDKVMSLSGCVRALWHGAEVVSLPSEATLSDSLRHKRSVNSKLSPTSGEERNRAPVYGASGVWSDFAAASAFSAGMANA
jgi:hypothetical protein